MKKILRSSAALGLVCAMTLSFFAGCSGSKQSDNQATTSATASTSEQTVQASAVTFDNAPVVKVMKIDSTSANRAASGYDDIDNPYSRYIFDKTGIKVILDWQPENGYDQNVQLRLASSSDIDMMFLAWSAEVSMNIARAGALEPVNDYLSKYQNVSKTYNEEYWKECSFDDKKYLLGNMILSPRVQHATLIRQDWLDKLSLTMPKTVSELYNVTKAFVTNKLDGASPTFGMTGRKDLTYFFTLSSAYGCPNAHPEQPYFFVDKQNKKLVCWQTTEAAKAYYKEAAKWWKEGLIDKEATTNSGDQFWSKINNGQVGIICHQPVSTGWLTTSIRQTQKKKEPTLAILPPITGTGYKNSFGTEGTHEIGEPYDGFYGIPKGNKNIDNLMTVLEFLCSEEGMQFNKYGLEGIEHDVVNGKKVLTRTRSDNISFSGDYAFTGDPSLVKGDIYNLTLEILAGGGDPEVDPGTACLERLTKAFEIIEPTVVPYQNWRLSIPRQGAEDKYPDYITAMKALYIKMVTGEVDANNDADWQKYLQDVEKTGLNEILKAKEQYLLTNAPKFFE